jgi:hypothetical protein
VSNDEPEGSDQGTRPTSGAYFSVEENTWMQSSSCSQSTIPEEWPVEATTFALNRETCRDVEKITDAAGAIVPLVDDRGFMIGLDCLPSLDGTCACGRSWGAATIKSAGHFILRTYVGAVVRERKIGVCPCGAELKWSPSAEYIHTIDNDSEGGIIEFASYSYYY